MKGVLNRKMPRLLLAAMDDGWLECGASTELERQHFPRVINCGGPTVAAPLPAASLSALAP